MLGLSLPKLILILFVALVIFGPKNLPKLGRSIGEGIKGLRGRYEEDDKEEKNDK